MNHPDSATLPALITGASSGIGWEFALQLAGKGYVPILVARRRDRLEELASLIERRHRVTPTILVADLETERGIASVEQKIAATGPLLLVNNAGFGMFGEASSLDQARQVAAVQLNAVALHRLSLAALHVNVAAGMGGIINVASAAGFLPMPYFATYAATKAFVLAFTEAVALEAKARKVRVMALCPGPVHSEFGKVAGAGSAFSGLQTLTGARCVRLALRAYSRGRPVYVPGWSMRTALFAMRFVPRNVVQGIVGTMMPHHQTDPTSS